MDCSICLENLLSRECIVLDCNHIFHKKCIYYANKDKSENKCSLCRSIVTIPNITKIKTRAVISDSYTQSIINDVVCLMDGNDTTAEFEKYFYSDIVKKSWFVSGGFALFLYKRLIELDESYNHSYSNINIYTFQDYIIFKDKCIHVNDFESSDNKYVRSDLIEYVKSINIDSKLEFSKIKTISINGNSLDKNQKISVIETTGCLPIDFIRLNNNSTENVYGLKNILIDVFKKIDLSCCKIAVRIVREQENEYTFKFYIDKAFYYEKYKVLYKDTEERVIKYRYRGFTLDEEIS